ncbi:RHS repeat protein [Entomomonas moraniae]|uniref:RHS repeat protein n=1 Tax=Entomomonas moraniae TaxID=2213226 RepID=A0A3Q9JJM3_9GAMM|nr:RHS repeat-associated core domain-containing protein [Entomomonas moraniae]AZS49737.1 RHS repeat protein [Entomomonas moraniae]
MSVFSQVIGMDTAEKADINKILKDFSESLNNYEEWAEGYISGYFLSANQKFEVGDEVTTQDKDNNSKVVVYKSCPVSEDKLTLIHAFETSKFIPIGNTPFKMEPVVDHWLWGKGIIASLPAINGTIDSTGKAEVNCTGALEYKITFYPNVTQAQIRAMYDSYQSILGTLKSWLESQWNKNFKTKWEIYNNATATDKLMMELEAVWNAIIKVLESMWGSITQVFDIIAHPQEHMTLLFEFFGNTDWEKVYNTAKEGLSKALIIAQDKGLMFILISALVAWFKMLPPQDLMAVKTELAVEFVMGLLVGVMLTGGAGLAVRLGTKVFQKANSRGAELLSELAHFLMDIFKGGRLETHSNVAKPIVVKGEGTVKAKGAGIHIKESDKPSVKANNTPEQKIDNSTLVDRSPNNNTVLEVENKKPAPNHNDSGKNPNNDKTESTNNTCTDGEPISMVTGEELLTLTDGTLEGLIPFNWTRLYRTSAVEINTGLGYGWSHSLSHHLRFTENNVIWTDHENRQITLPLPTEQCPAYTNNLAGAAIYLGNKDNEYILVQAGEQKNIYHFARTQAGAQLEAISDNYGNKLHITRDLMGKIKRIHNGAGRALMLRYHNGHIIGVDYQKEIPGETIEQSWQTIHTLITYEYNERSQLIKATNAANETEHYHYNEHHVIEQRQLAGGAIFNWQWEGQGKSVRAIRQWSNYGQLDTRYEWDDNGSVLITRKDGSQQLYTHDQNAKLIKQIDPDGAETLKDYDDNGNLIAERNALGAETLYEYDDQNRLRAIHPAEAEPTHYFYSWGFLKQIWQGEAKWHYKHNAQGNIIEQTDPHGNTTQYSYTTTGKINTISYPDGSTHELNWNKLGQLIDETLPQGGTRRYRYDAMGRQIIRQDEQGQTTQFEYDPVGRLTRITFPNGTSKSYRYNAYGKITHETDQQGKTTRYDYVDNLHLISQRTNPDGSTVQYQYNNTGLNLTDITNEQGERYHLDYYPNGLISQEIGFDGRKTSYQYDMGGNLIAKTDYDDQGNPYTTTYLRSPEGKLLQKTLPDGKQINYAYNQLGLLQAVDDGQWPLNYEYDITGKLTAEHQGWATLRYQYSPLGILSQCKLPDGNVIDYKYQKGGQLAQINLNDQKLTEHFYSLGQEVERQQGTLTSQYDYDEQGRLKAHFVNHSTKTLYQRKYQYSANGNLAAIEDSRKGLRQYHYDPLDRLIQVRGDISEDLIHDPAGNLLAQDHKTQQANIKGNRLLMQGDKHFTYDSFGNLIQEARGQNQQLITRYQYDSQQQLIQATMPDGTNASYQYDAFGRRINKVVTDKLGHKTKTEFIWLCEKLLAESSKGHYQTYLYEQGTFKPLALLKGKGKKAEIYYYQLDHLGTPQELTTANGSIAWSAKYKAYGSLAVAEIKDVEQPLRFQGQYHDFETGLYYNRNRYYAPDTGRYITPDPIKLAGGLNNYQYCNNPIGWIDPLGLACKPGGCPGDNSTSTKPEEKAVVEDNKPSTPDPYTNFPDDPNELTKVLGVEPKVSTTQHGTTRMVWEPNQNMRIRYESHPGDSGPFNARHHGEHYHIELKPAGTSWNQANKKGLIQKAYPDNYQPGHGTGFIPGEKHPGL